jgi:hypothetical protein
MTGTEMIAQLHALAEIEDVDDLQRQLHELTPHVQRELEQLDDQALWRLGMKSGFVDDEVKIAIQTRIRHYHVKGENDREIADRFGVDKSTVQRWRSRMGLPANAEGANKMRQAEGLNAQIADLIAVGKSQQEIGDELGLSRTAIRSRLTTHYMGTGADSTPAHESDDLAEPSEVRCLEPTNTAYLALLTLSTRLDNDAGPRTDVDGALRTLDKIEAVVDRLREQLA